MARVAIEVGEDKRVKWNRLGVVNRGSKSLTTSGYFDRTLAGGALIVQMPAICLVARDILAWGGVLIRGSSDG
jgi:hypothetical protein